MASCLRVLRPSAYFLFFLHAKASEYSRFLAGVLSARTGIGAISLTTDTSSWLGQGSINNFLFFIVLVLAGDAISSVFISTMRQGDDVVRWDG